MRPSVAFVLCAAFVTGSLLVAPLAAQEKTKNPNAENWVCTLDLHQGDTGTLRFSRDRKGNIEGQTIVFRGDRSSEHAVKGRWVDAKIVFNRRLSGNSYQPFEGESHEEQNGLLVIMTGRFAAKMAGEWSAECRLREPAVGQTPIVELRRPMRVRADKSPPKVTARVDGILSVTLGDPISIIAEAVDEGGLRSISVFVDGAVVATCPASPCRVSHPTSTAGLHRFWAEAEDKNRNRGRSPSLEFMVHPSSKPGPSLNTRTNPYHPSSQDRVRFIADASHSSGVSLVEIHVNGTTVKRCESAHCEYSGGPYAAGSTLRWRVSAHSRNGGITYGTQRELSISGAPATGSCVITGRAVGAKKDVAKVFVLNLYGPNDTSSFRESTRFAANGGFRFSGLPSGRYRIAVDTPADVYVETAPRQQTVQCNAGVVEAMNIEFR